MPSGLPFYTKKMGEKVGKVRRFAQNLSIIREAGRHFLHWKNEFKQLFGYLFTHIFYTTRPLTPFFSLTYNCLFIGYLLDARWVGLFPYLSLHQTRFCRNFVIYPNSLIVFIITVKTCLSISVPPVWPLSVDIITLTCDPLSFSLLLSSWWNVLD